MTDSSDPPAAIPPPVRDMTATELAALRAAGAAFELIDVRSPEERAYACIDGSTLLDAQSAARIAALPRDTHLVFYCHAGVRSARAAEYFRQQGFDAIHNLVGGIDAWSLEVDPCVPRY